LYIISLLLPEITEEVSDEADVVDCWLELRLGDEVDRLNPGGSLARVKCCSSLRGGGGVL